MNQDIRSRKPSERIREHFEEVSSRPHWQGDEKGALLEAVMLYLDEKEEQEKPIECALCILLDEPKHDRCKVVRMLYGKEEPAPNECKFGYCFKHVRKDCPECHQPTQNHNHYIPLGHTPTKEDCEECFGKPTQGKEERVNEECPCCGAYERCGCPTRTYPVEEEPKEKELPCEHRNVSPLEWENKLDNINTGGHYIKQVGGRYTKFYCHDCKEELMPNLQ